MLLNNDDIIYNEWKRLYEEDKLTLRAIAKKYNTNHHLVKRHLMQKGVIITTQDRKREPMSEERKQYLSLLFKGRPSMTKGKEMSLLMRYKNMKGHLKFNVELDFLLQFEDIEKLKQLNKIITRDRVRIHFTDETYKQFIIKFYNDENFTEQFSMYMKTKNKYDLPSLDHIIPLSRGGTWDLTNLQIISWFDNRAKCDMTQQEYDEMRKKYWTDIKKE